MATPNHRFALRVAATALAATLASQMAAPTIAADDDRWWYFDRYDFDTLHAEGLDGSGITIAVLDTPINLESPPLHGASIETIHPSECSPNVPLETFNRNPSHDKYHHGTLVISMIVGQGASPNSLRGMKGVAPGAHILHYASGGKPCEEWVSEAGIHLDVIDAVDRGADIITIQVDTNPISWDYNPAILYALQHDVIVIAAMPNASESSRNLRGTTVENRNGILTVQAGGPDGSLPLIDGEIPYMGDWVDVCAPGLNIGYQTVDEDGRVYNSYASGTSFAAPWVAGILALAMQKYPDATPNQILQALIHNTGIEGPHPAEWDAETGCGYGPADPITLLADDPTTYPDVNPFIEDAPRNEHAEGWGPTLDEIYPPEPSPEPSATPDPTPSHTATPTPGDDATGSWLTTALIIGLAGALVIAAVIVVTVAAAKRQKGETP